MEQSRHNMFLSAIWLSQSDIFHGLKHLIFLGFEELLVRLKRFNL